MKVAICAKHGGFGLSPKVVLYGRKQGHEWAKHPNVVLDGEKFDDGSGPYKAHGDDTAIDHDGDEMAFRSNPELISDIESIGLEESSGPCCRLKIVDVPDDIECEISEYDGYESIEESHRSWS